jgi:hypothetical protein
MTAAQLRTAIHSTIKQIETDVAWVEHNDNWQQIGDVAIHMVRKLRTS